jgi:hypothetical protein
MLRPRPVWVLLAAAVPLTCGAPPITTIATLAFSVTIPGFIFLRVGSGGAPNYGTNSTIDSLVFNVPVGQVGSGTPIDARASDGDLGNGTVTAQAHCTVGSMQVRSNVTGALSNGNGDTIPWSQIGVTYSTSVGSLGNANFPTNSYVQDGWSISFADTVWRDGTWTFRYLNQAIVPPGTYGGTVAKNGRITYTATAL